jgi:hypothetical protein
MPLTTSVDARDIPAAAQGQCEVLCVLTCVLRLVVLCLWRNGFPTTNRTSPGSTSHGNHQNPTQSGTIKARHGSHPRSRSMMAAFSSWNTHDHEGVPHENRCKNFSTKLLGNAGRIGIFAFEEFSHESGRKPLSLAQIRRLEVPVSSFHRNTVSPKHQNTSSVPLFPRNPLFPALRSGHRLFQRPSPGKQFPCSKYRTYEKYEKNVLVNGNADTGNHRRGERRHWVHL